MKRPRYCPQCGNPIPEKNGKYCSRVCMGLAVKGVERPVMKGKPAWNKGRSAENDERVRRVAQAKFKNVVDRDTLHTLYVEQNQTLRDIGVIYGVSKHVIGRLVEEYGLQRKRDTLTPEVITQLYEAGKTLSQIGDMYECSHGYVRKICPDLDARHFQNRAAIVATPELLQQLYWEEWLSYESIAERLGVDLTTIPYWLKKFGIPRRTAGETRRGKDWIEPSAETVVHLYAAENMSAQSIASTLAIGRHMVENILASEGIPLRRSGYPNISQYTAKDGHRVKSSLELQVDNWLYDHGIAHSYEPRLGTSYKRADFLVQDFYIEIWGITGNKRYEDKRQNKLNLYQSLQLQLLSVYPHDFPKLHVLEPLTKIVI